MPDPYRDLEEVEGYRARTLVGFTYGLIAFGVLFAYIYSAVFGMRIAGYAVLLAIATTSLGPVLLRRTGRLDWAGNWVSFNLYWVVVALTAMTGGLVSPAAEWLIPVPLYAVLFSGMSVGLGWALLIAATFLAFYLLPGYGIQIPQMLSAAELQQLQVWGLTGLTLLVLQLVVLSEWVHKWAIGQLHEVQRELEERAFYDPLTELPNRRSLQSHFAKVLDRERDEKRSKVLGLIDLDDFKMINDSIGHPAGDAVLREFGERLDDVVPHPDFVARIGGDEFVLLVESVEGEDDLVSIGEDLEEMLSEPCELAETQVHLSASIGLVGVSSEQIRETDEHKLLRALMRSADRAMYAAKEIPGTAWKSRRLGEDVREAQPLHLENRVREAVEQDEFVAYFQPIFRISEERPYGAEVLARWDHPERGILTAGEFIPLAQRSDLIEHVGRAVIEDAYRRIEDSGLPDFVDDTFELYFNLSPRQLQVEDAIEQIGAILDRHGHPKIEPKLEVTEKHWLRNTDDIIDLRERGYSLIIDDFGQGYSSLSRLTELPIDGIKIDRSFVSKMTDNEADAMVVELVAQFGERLEVPVIAEGIETAAQNEAVRRAGVTGAQGFYLGRPRPIDELVDRLRGIEPSEERREFEEPLSSESSGDEAPGRLAEVSNVTFGDRPGSLAADSSHVSLAETSSEVSPDSKE